jgi:hypothetical protein
MISKYVLTIFWMKSWRGMLQVKTFQSKKSSLHVQICSNNSVNWFKECKASRDLNLLRRKQPYMSFKLWPPPIWLKKKVRIIRNYSTRGRNRSKKISWDRNEKSRRIRWRKQWINRIKQLIFIDNKIKS